MAQAVGAVEDAKKPAQVTRAGCSSHLPMRTLTVVRESGAEGARTPDPQNAILMLSQLSYSPIWPRLSVVSDVKAPLRAQPGERRAAPKVAAFYPKAA